MSVSGIFSGVAGAVFQTSPIILTNGLASSIWKSITSQVSDVLPSFTQNSLPLSIYTEALTIAVGGGQQLTGTGVLSQSFANYKPLPGSTLASYQIAEYPFYDQRIAANAAVQRPLNVSMLMYCPANSSTSLAGIKLAVMSLVQNVITNHVQAGGTFTVLTPAYIYTNCLLTGITDVSTEETLQTQWAYQWDFVQPLLDMSPAADLNSSMSKIAYLGTNPLP